MARRELIQKGIELFDTLGYQAQSIYYQTEFQHILNPSKI